MMPKIKAVIVTFESNLERLDSILEALTYQCEIIVIDNSVNEQRALNIARCVKNNRGQYFSMGGNYGIGFAQNRGIMAAFNQGADAVLLLDDDSFPSGDLVKQLVSYSEKLNGMSVICANPIDEGGCEIGNARHTRDSESYFREMMSSGSLISRKIFDRVGLFNEDLFIDCVDFDWGWRAQKIGVDLIFCSAATITHQLGEGVVAGVRYPSPIRHYFQYRNILFMTTKSYTPWGWKISQLIKLCAKLFLIPILMPDKSMRLYYVFMGIYDAIRGRLGPCSMYRKLR